MNGTDFMNGGIKDIARAGVRFYPHNRGILYGVSITVTTLLKYPNRLSLLLGEHCGRQYDVKTAILIRQKDGAAAKQLRNLKVHKKLARKSVAKRSFGLIL